MYRSVTSNRCRRGNKGIKVTVAAIFNVSDSICDTIDSLVSTGCKNGQEDKGGDRHAVFTICVNSSVSSMIDVNDFVSWIAVSEPADRTSTNDCRIEGNSLDVNLKNIE